MTCQHGLDRSQITCVQCEQDEAKVPRWMTSPADLPPVDLDAECPLPEPVVLFWYRSDTNFSFRWVSPEGLFNEKEWHPLYGEESLALAARAERDAQIERLKEEDRKWVLGYELLTAQLAQREAEVERLQKLVDAYRAADQHGVEKWQTDLTQRDERIRELEEAKQLSEWDHENWAKARQRAEAAEARLKELEQIHEEEWRNLKTERDALRARLEKYENAESFMAIPVINRPGPVVPVKVIERPAL